MESTSRGRQPQDCLNPCRAGDATAGTSNATLLLGPGSWEPKAEPDDVGAKEPPGREPSF
jgi:hypothetical protein